MKKNTIIGLLCIFLLVYACKKQNKEFIVTKYGEIELNTDTGLLNTSQDYFGTYAGVKYCHQCGKDINVFLTLNQDYTYSLKVEEHHQWVLTKGSYSIEDDIIKLDNKEGSEYQLDEGELYLLNPKDMPISHVDFSYSLNKIN